ncbi:unnamed protein product [Rhodiola kirilowii]
MGLFQNRQIEGIVWRALLIFPSGGFERKNKSTVMMDKGVDITQISKSPASLVGCYPFEHFGSV